MITNLNPEEIIIKEEFIDKIVRQEMHIDYYNTRKKSGQNRIIKFDLDNTNNAIIYKNTGWALSDIDILAIEDFVYNRDCTMQDALKFSLRYYISNEIYSIAYNYMDTKIMKTMINDYKSKMTNIEIYHNNIGYDSAYILDDSYSSLLRKPSWKIPYIDYSAASVFKKIYKMKYKDIITNALRCYLLKSNYTHAEEMVNLKTKHKNENEKQIREKIEEKL